MVLPIIAAGARTVGSAVAKKGTQAASKKATQTAVNTTRNKIQNSGRNITRSKRTEQEGVNNLNQKRDSVIRSRDNVRANQNISDPSSNQSSEEVDITQKTQKNASKKHIGIAVSAILCFIAGSLDLTELALDAAGTFLVGVGVVFGYFKDFFTVIFFPTIFWALGVPFWRGRKAKKKMIYMVTSFLVGLVPWLGALMPETLISVMVTIHLTNKEAKEEIGEVKVNPNIVRTKRNN